MLRYKDGKNVDAREMQKRLDMAGIKWNSTYTRSEINIKIEEAKEKWNECVKRLKKKKEEEFLDLQENEYNLEEENDTKNRTKTLKALKKGVTRNSDFRYLTNNVGKGKKNGSRKLEVEEVDEVVIVRNKDEIEQKIIQHNK